MCYYFAGAGRFSIPVYRPAVRLNTPELRITMLGRERELETSPFRFLDGLYVACMPADH